MWYNSAHKGIIPQQTDGEDVDKYFSSNCYLVSEELLPEAIKRTAQVKELLASDRTASLNDALAKVGISKSTYYKYKDGVFTFHNLGTNEIVNLSLSLRNQSGVLSGVLGAVADCGGNVLTINQGLPAMGEATVTISVGMGNAVTDPGSMLDRLSSLPGVSGCRIDGIQN